MDFNTLILSITSFIAGILAIPVGGTFFLTVPVMLMLGLNGLEALLLSRVYAVACLGGGSAYFFIKNKYEWKKIFYFLSGNLIGFMLSAKLISSIHIDTLTKIIPWILLAGIIFLVKDFKITKPHLQKRLMSLIPFVGLLLGFYGGLGGSGTGPAIVIFLSLALGWDMHKSIVNSRLIELIGCIFIVALYLYFGATFTGYEIPVIIAAAIGGVIGAKITFNINPVWIKRALLVLVVITVIKTSWPVIIGLFQ